MVNGDSGSPKNTPAPWVPYTRAGCDFGRDGARQRRARKHRHRPERRHDQGVRRRLSGVERGPASNAAPAGTAARTSPRPTSSGSRSTAPRAAASAREPARQAGSAADEPGGYNGFKGLFGAKYVNPAITGGSAVVNNLDGQPITDPFDQPGFPGFDGLFASTTLSYVATDAGSRHPDHLSATSRTHTTITGYTGELHIAYGPGEPGYVAQLKAYDQAFEKFFDRLAADGITKDNTLFVVTVEEGDHFVRRHADPGRVRRRDHTVQLQPPRRGQRQPRRPARHPARDHDAVHRSRGYGADDLSHWQPGRGLRSSRATSAGRSGSSRPSTRTPARPTSSRRRSPIRSG